VDGLFENIAIGVADEEGRDTDGLASPIVGHDQVLGIFELFVVNDDGEDSSKGLDVHGFLDKVAVSSVHKNDELVS